MLAIIIPTMIATIAFAWWFRRGNTKATYRPDWEYSGAIEMVVWAIPALTIMLLGGIAWIGSHDLEPSKPLKSDDAAAQGRSRLARLEMAVHLPRPGHRDGQPAGRSGRHAGQLPADLGDRLEQLLRPADGDDDLHHAADDDAPEPAGGPARASTTACRRISAATASPACSSRSSRCRPTSSRCGRRARADQG